MNKLRMNLNKQVLRYGQEYLSPRQKEIALKTGKLTVVVFT